jgi:rod shape-determining protein MreD
MSRTLGFWLALVLLPVLHFLLKVGFGLGNAVPDLLTLALLLTAREVRSGAAAGFGFFYGLLEDAFAILSFGANTLVLTVLASLGARSRDLFVGESLLFFSLYLGGGTWLRAAFHWLLSDPEGRGAAGPVLLAEAPLTALYTTGVGLLLLFLTGRLVRERK